MSDNFSLSTDWARLIAEQIEEVLFSLDKEWRFTFLNHKATQVLGKSVESLLGRVLWEEFPSLLGTSFEALYRQAMESGEVAFLEDFSTTSRAWFEVRVYPISQGLIVYFRDISERKQLEKASQESEYRFKVLGEATFDGILIHRDAIVIEANERAAQLLGYANSRELIGLPLTQFTTRPITLAQIQQRLTEAPEGMQYNILKRKDGTTFQADGWNRVIDYFGQPAQVGTIRDITDFKKLEQTLRESETRFRTLSEAALEGIVIYQNDTIVEVNRNTLAMFGYNFSTELIGQPVAILFTPDSLPTIQKRIAENSDENYEISGRRKDGSTFPLEKHGKATEYQGKPARVIALRDLSYQKQVEQTLRESEHRYRILSEASFEGLVVHDNGRILLANEAMAQMTGYSVEELGRMSVFQLVTPQTQIELRERLINNLEGLAKGEFIRKDGSHFLMEARSRIVEYQDQIVRLVAVRDVTEVKQAEEALKKTQAQLTQSQKLEGIGRLAGGIAHDFNNLLTVITGYAELAINSVAEDTTLYADLREIATAAERAASLTRQLLIFSRQQVTQPGLLNLNQVVTEMDRLLQRLLGEDIDLVCLLEPALGEVLGDPHQLEQVIMNLAVNARDAMPEGGKLTIETANVELDEAYRAAGHVEIKTGSYVMLAISDTGTGMDAEIQQKVFEPFFTTKPVGQGTGLGLATVYGIVKETGGYIFLYSEVGQGTTFKVYLPRLKALPRAPLDKTGNPITALTDQLTLPQLAKESKTYRILVVEDDGLVRELVYKVLTEAGHRPVLARDGQEALALLKAITINSKNNEEPIELVITDIIMPQMSGRVLIEELRQQWPAIRVICMSGYTERVVERHELLRQCQSFLQKPFTPRVLLERIEDAMYAKS